LECPVQEQRTNKREIREIREREDLCNFCAVMTTGVSLSPQSLSMPEVVDENFSFFPPAIGCEELTEVNNVSGQVFTIDNFR
jgi:hypothetical protein